MQGQHWVLVAVVAVVFYVIGAKFPSVAHQIGVA